MKLFKMIISNCVLILMNIEKIKKPIVIQKKIKNMVDEKIKDLEKRNERLSSTFGQVIITQGSYNH